MWHQKQHSAEKDGIPHVHRGRCLATLLLRVFVFPANTHLLLSGKSLPCVIGMNWIVRIRKEQLFIYFILKTNFKRKIHGFEVYVYRQISRTWPVTKCIFLVFS